MQELKEQIEVIPTAEDDMLFVWFALSNANETFYERLGVDQESNDYRITEK